MRPGYKRLVNNKTRGTDDIIQRICSTEMKKVANAKLLPFMKMTLDRVKTGKNSNFKAINELKAQISNDQSDISEINRKFSIIIKLLKEKKEEQKEEQKEEGKKEEEEKEEQNEEQKKRRKRRR